MEVSGGSHTTVTLSQENNSSTYWSGGWVGPGVDLEMSGDEKISSGQDSNCGLFNILWKSLYTELMFCQSAQR